MRVRPVADTTPGSAQMATWLAADFSTSALVTKGIQPDHHGQQPAQSPDFGPYVPTSDLPAGNALPADRPTNGAQQWAHLNNWTTIGPFPCNDEAEEPLSPTVVAGVTSSRRIIVPPNEENDELQVVTEELAWLPARQEGQEIRPAEEATIKNLRFFSWYATTEISMPADGTVN